MCIRDSLYSVWRPWTPSMAISLSVSSKYLFTKKKIHLNHAVNSNKTSSFKLYVSLEIETFFSIWRLYLCMCAAFCCLLIALCKASEWFVSDNLVIFITFNYFPTVYSGSYTWIWVNLCNVQWSDSCLGSLGSRCLGCLLQKYWAGEFNANPSRLPRQILFLNFTNTLREQNSYILLQ